MAYTRAELINKLLSKLDADRAAIGNMLNMKGGFTTESLLAYETKNRYRLDSKADTAAQLRTIAQGLAAWGEIKIMTSRGWHISSGNVTITWAGLLSADLVAASHVEAAARVYKLATRIGGELEAHAVSALAVDARERFESVSVILNGAFPEQNGKVTALTVHELSFYAHLEITALKWLTPVFNSAYITREKNDEIKTLENTPAYNWQDIWQGNISSTQSVNLSDTYTDIVKVETDLELQAITVPGPHSGETSPAVIFNDLVSALGKIGETTFDTVHDMLQVYKDLNNDMRDGLPLGVIAYWGQGTQPGDEPPHAPQYYIEALKNKLDGYVENSLLDMQATANAINADLSAFHEANVYVQKQDEENTLAFVLGIVAGCVAAVGGGFLTWGAVGGFIAGASSKTLLTLSGNVFKDLDAGFATASGGVLLAGLGGSAGNDDPSVSLNNVAAHLGEINTYAGGRASATLNVGISNLFLSENITAAGEYLNLGNSLMSAESLDLYEQFRQEGSNAHAAHDIGGTFVDILKETFTGGFAGPPDVYDDLWRQFAAKNAPQEGYIYLFGGYDDSGGFFGTPQIGDELRIDVYKVKESWTSAFGADAHEWNYFVNGTTSKTGALI